MVSDYYYRQLSKIQQQAYFAMLEGFLQIAPSFYVPKLSGKELGDIFFLLRLDHPEIFYAVSFRYRYYQDAENALLEPEYLFEKKKIQEHQKALESRIRKLTDKAAGLDEKAKEQYIHDFICGNIHYDKLKKPYSHEIIGPLENGVGVCEGIAKTVKILCDKMGIWCIIALSEANPEKKIKYRHAWNIVKIGGKYYHLDATFDNTVGNEHVRYDYFNLCDRQVFRDHEPVIWKIPECSDGASSYYQTAKLSFTKYEDISKRSAQAVKKGKTLIFNWRGGYLTREVLTDIMKLISEEAEKKGKVPDVRLNWPQAVFELSFREKTPEEAAACIAAESEGDSADRIILQEANEGEQE